MTTLITGGTGFLGLYIVREQLLKGRAVTVLAHSGSPSARERIVDFLAQTGVLDQLGGSLDDQLSVVEGDLCLPRLGLSPQEHLQLAERVSAIWHVAASIVLDGHDERVWRTNVVGTQHVLEFANFARQGTPLYYVSSAAVAGSTTGFIPEDLVTHETAFLNTYERSKYTGECLVRAWGADRESPVLIFRPPILVPSHRLTGPHAPQHTLGSLCTMVDLMLARSSVALSRTPIRVHGDLRASLNLLQVGWAAAAMVALADGVNHGVSTLHVVHPQNVYVRTIAAALEDTLPVRVRIVPAAPNDPTPFEKAFYFKMRGFLRYLRQNQQFDDSRMWAALDMERPTPVDRGYLASHLASQPKTPIARGAGRTAPATDS
jgi:thioester reductase-like protein